MCGGQTRADGQMQRSNTAVQTAEHSGQTRATGQAAAKLDASSPNRSESGPFWGWIFGPDFDQFRGQSGRADASSSERRTHGLTPCRRTVFERSNAAAKRSGQTRRLNAAVKRGGQTRRSNAAAKRGGQTQWSNTAVKRGGQTRRPNAAAKRGDQTQRPNAAIKRSGQTQRSNTSVKRGGQTRRPNAFPTSDRPGRNPTRSNRVAI